MKKIQKMKKVQRRAKNIPERLIVLLKYLKEMDFSDGLEDYSLNLYKQY